MKYPEQSRRWYFNSNYLCQLSIENEQELEKLAYKAELKGIKVTRFREPDLNNSLTSICLEASKETRRLVSSLSLMLKEKEELQKVN